VSSITLIESLVGITLMILTIACSSATTSLLHLTLQRVSQEISIDQYAENQSITCKATDFLSEHILHCTTSSGSNRMRVR